MEVTLVSKGRSRYLSSCAAQTVVTGRGKRANHVELQFSICTLIEEEMWEHHTSQSHVIAVIFSMPTSVKYCTSVEIPSRKIWGLRHCADTATVTCLLDNVHFGLAMQQLKTNTCEGME